MKTPKFLLLLGVLSLSACGTTPSGPAALPSPTAPAVTRAPLTSFGLYELALSSLTEKPQAVVTPAGLGGQAAEVQGLRFTPVSMSTSTDEAARIRYVRATFKVTNQSGKALSAPTFVPVDTDGEGGTVGQTAFKDVQFFDGSDASTRAADLQLGPAQRLNAATGQHEIDPDATPFKQGLDTRTLSVGVPTGQRVARVFREGWQSGPVAEGGEQIVTFAAQLPMASRSALDPFAFRLVFAVTDNPAPLPSDLTAPTVKLTLDPTTLTAAGPVTFRAEASDDQAVREVSFYQGEKLLGTDGSAPYEWTTSYAKADNGQYDIRAVATDTSDNSAEAKATLTVQIADAPSDAKATVGADVIRSNRGEPVSGSAVTLYRTGDRAQPVAQGQTDARGHVEFVDVPEGVYDMVFSKAGSAASELIGAVAKAGKPMNVKVAQFDAINPTADKVAPKLALLTPSALDASGQAQGWKTLSAGTVMNDEVQLRAYTTADNPSPLLLKYMLFSLVNFDADGNMADLRNGLFSVDVGNVTPGEGSQDSGQTTLDAAGLSGDIYVQVSSLDFNNNRSAYIVPIKLSRSEAASEVGAPTNVRAVAYTNSERVNFIYSTVRPDAQSPIAPNSNSWVSVSWDMPASTTGLTGFRVLRATEAQGPYREVAFAGTAQCNATTKRCTVSDNTATLEVGQDYYYRVKAIGSNEATSGIPALPSTRILPPFAPQMLTPGSEEDGVSLTPTFTFKTNAFAGGATGLRFDVRVSDNFTAVRNSDAPPVRLINQNGTFKLTGVDTDTRDYSGAVGYDPSSDIVSVPLDLTRVRSGLAPTPLQANRRYSWLINKAFTYRLLDPTQPESATNPIVAYSVYADPDSTKIVPGGSTQSAGVVHHFITRP